MINPKTFLGDTAFDSIESSCGRMFYIYPETIRGSEEWDYTYKIRSATEKGIDHFKHNYCIDGLRTHNKKTLHAD